MHLLAKKKIGLTNTQDISNICSAFGVSVATPCKFSVETLFNAESLDVQKTEAAKKVNEEVEAKFQDYLQLLVKRGYFNQTEEGSDLYNERLKKARDRFFAKFEKPVIPSDPYENLTKEQRAEEAEKHKNLANELLKERKWQEAIDEYTIALKYAENAVIYANRAVPYGKLSKFEEAINDCKKSIDLDPHYIKGHMRLGYMYFQSKDYKNAVLAYKQGLVYDPNNETLKNDLAKAQSQLQPPEQQSGIPGGMPPDMNMMQNMMKNMGGMGADGMGPQMPANFMEMMSNPQFMQAAQSFMMSNPNIMNWAQQVAQNPDALQQIFQGKIPEGMPMPDNMEDMMQNLPSNLQGPWNNKDDEGGIGGI